MIFSFFLRPVLLQIAALLVITISSGIAFAKSPITSLAFAPGEQRIVAGSQRGLTVYRWPILEEIRHVELEMGQIQDLCFSPDGKRLLVSGGAPSEFGEWSLLSWPELRRIAGQVFHDDIVHSSVWISDECFVTASADRRVAKWSLPGSVPEVIQAFVGHSRRVLAVEYMPKVKLLVSAGVDQSLRVWPSDSKTTKVESETAAIRVLDNHTDLVRGLARRPGEFPIPFLASISVDKTVRFWQPSIGRLVRFVRLPTEPVSAAWAHDGRSIGVACVDGYLRVIDPNTVKVKESKKAIDGWPYAVCAAADGSFAVAGTAGQVVRVSLAK